MTTISKKFTKDSEIKAFDINHRNTLKFNISRYHKAVNRGKTELQISSIKLLMIWKII